MFYLNMFPSKAILHLILSLLLLFHVASTVTAARDLSLTSISNMEVKGARRSLLDVKYAAPPPPCRKICLVLGEPVCCIH